MNSIESNDVLNGYFSSKTFDKLKFCTMKNKVKHDHKFNSFKSKRNEQ
jgi:hypothetical protein